MASECYKEKDDTAEKWIEAVKEQGINCVAVTDHNDYRGIESIATVGKEKGITVFPGVEITCDTSKIHILIIFDVLKTYENVRDFLSACDIDIDKIGKNDGTILSVFDVCKKAKAKGALVIAAHIDEYSGINSMSPANIKEILNNKYIDAVQVVNEKLWEEYKKSKDINALLDSLRDKYGNEISKDEAEKWRKTYDKAVEAHIPLLTFSDNPFEEGASKHGLWGIGKEFTWIKMDQTPNLESVRQAFLSEDIRIKRSTQISQCPERLPDFWIKSLSIEGTNINPHSILEINFNPQLNTIIGGRGSGKSSIIRILAGALGTVNKSSLKVISDEQKDFYKKYERKTGLGIFSNTSSVKVCVYRNGVRYKINITNIQDSNKQKVALYKILDDGTKEEIKDENFLDFFKLQVYTQKQIFEVAKDPDALLKIIDSDIDDMPYAVRDREELYDKLLAKLSEIRTIENAICNEAKLQAELADIVEQIENYKKSGISALLEEKQRLTQEDKLIKEYLQGVESVAKALNTVLTEVCIPDIDDGITDKDIRQLLEKNRANILNSIEDIHKSLGDIDQQKAILQDLIQKSEWSERKNINEQNYINACEGLSEEDWDTKKLDELLVRQKNKQEEIDKILRQKQQLIVLEEEKDKIKKEYEDKLIYIRKERQEFINSVIGKNDTVKIQINPFSEKNSFEHMIKEYTQKDGISINADIEKLSNDVFGKGGIESFRKTILEIRKGVENKQFSAVLKKAIQDMDEKIFDKMITFIPSDELVVQYKPEGGRKYLPLSSASAGQKTTAILTFILAYGKIPLLLDQPEDDLDNKLVYDLVVKRLKKAKSKRQVIVVTHNANIPVNGDAEYITSMDSATRFVQIKAQGTLDKEEVRKEICDVMEGTEYAFEMRAKKYHLK